MNSQSQHLYKDIKDMEADQDHLSELLSVYRSNLRHLQRQAAMHGGEENSPISLINELSNTREDIKDIKEKVVFYTAMIERKRREINLEGSIKIEGRLEANPIVTIVDIQQPPSRAEYLLRFLPIPHKDREAVIGDLEEEYQDIHHQFGQKQANYWYWCQVIYSFSPYVKAAIKSAIKWSAIGWVPSVFHLGWEYIRKYM